MRIDIEKYDPYDMLIIGIQSFSNLYRIRKIYAGQEDMFGYAPLYKVYFICG